MSNSLRPHESQHARPPCPSPTPGVYPNSCPSSWWCHPAISSSVVPFSSWPQSLQWNTIKQLKMYEELTHLKRPWFWERLRAGREVDDERWDSWMASPTQWTWICVDPGSWWWTGRPGVLWFMRLQRVGHDWATELNWTCIIITSRLKEKTVLCD